MDTSTKRVFKWFWAWNDRQEEAWLWKMSQDGWHLSAVSFPCVYTFQRGEPRHYVYRVDYVIGYRDYQAYLQDLQKAGWTCLETLGAWHYFRIEANAGEYPEIHASQAEKIQHYQNMILTVFLALFLLLPADGFMLNRGAGVLAALFSILVSLLIALFIFALIMLLRRVMALRREASV